MAWETRTGVVSKVVKIAQLSTFAVPDERNFLKAKMMCHDPRRLKGRGRIPLFEAMLSLEQRRARYSRSEMPKDRKGLEY